MDMAIEAMWLLKIRFEPETRLIEAAPVSPTKQKARITAGILAVFIVI